MHGRMPDCCKLADPFDRLEEVEEESSMFWSATGTPILIMTTSTGTHYREITENDV